MEYSLKMEKLAFYGSDSVLFPVMLSFYDKPHPDGNSNLLQFYLSHESLSEKYFHYFDNKNTHKKT